MKTICIDARLWGTRNTGPGRYTQELIRHLPSKTDIQLVLIVSPQNIHNPELGSYRKFIARHHPYSLLAQLEMFYFGLKIHPDLLHSPHFTVPLIWPGKVIVTIHDLIKHYSRGPATSTRGVFLYWLKYLAYRFNVWFAVHRSAHILVPSRYWKEKLMQLYGLADSKITVTYEGVSAGFVNSTPAQIDIPDHRPYVLHVGNIYPHKNIPALLSAIKILNGRVLLILVCPRTVFTARLNSLIIQTGIGHLVKVMNYLPDTDLLGLYQHALAYVFPSFIEGFGLPGLEAMAAGTAVIASNSSCLPEIYGPAALYFNPHDSQGLADLILELQAHPSRRQALIRTGSTWVKKYSWAKMGQQTWKIYRAMLP